MLMTSLASYFAFIAQAKVTQERKENIGAIHEQAGSYLLALARYEEIYCTVTGNVAQSSLFPGFIGASWRPVYGSTATFEISKTADIAHFTVAVTFSTKKQAQIVGARKKKNFDVQYVAGTSVVKFNMNKQLKAALSRSNFDNSYLSSRTPNGC